jgi:hypothetical protein
MNESNALRHVDWLNDFATIFAWRWYRDFPKVPPYREAFRRADATIHIGVAVRATADLMGLFSHFESGQRTDCILKDNAGSAVAGIEWEWRDVIKKEKVDPRVNEIQKLKGLHEVSDGRDAQFAAFIGYVKKGNAETAMSRIRDAWSGSLLPLLLVLIHYERLKKKRREFINMSFDRIDGQGNAQRLREQAAYPWDVKGARWELFKGTGRAAQN